MIYLGLCSQQNSVPVVLWGGVRTRLLGYRSPSVTMPTKRNLQLKIWEPTMPWACALLDWNHHLTTLQNVYNTAQAMTA